MSAFALGICVGVGSVAVFCLFVFVALIVLSRRNLPDGRSDRRNRARQTHVDETTT